MATEFKINPRYSGKKRVRVSNKNGELVDLVAKQAYDLEIPETKKKAAYKLPVKVASKKDLEFHFSKGKQKLIQKLVNDKVVAWNAEATTDVAPASIATGTADSNKKKNSGQ